MTVILSEKNKQDMRLYCTRGRKIRGKLLLYGAPYKWLSPKFQYQELDKLLPWVDRVAADFIWWWGTYSSRAKDKGLTLLHSVVRAAWIKGSHFLGVLKPQLVRKIERQNRLPKNAGDVIEFLKKIHAKRWNLKATCCDGNILIC